MVLRLRVVGGAGDLVQGPRVNWIGYCLNIHTFHKGINASKREWIVQWITKKLELGGVVAELKSVLGRLSEVADETG